MRVECQIVPQHIICAGVQNRMYLLSDIFIGLFTFSALQYPWKIQSFNFESLLLFCQFWCTVVTEEQDLIEWLQCCSVCTTSICLNDKKKNAVAASSQRWSCLCWFQSFVFFVCANVLWSLPYVLFLISLQTFWVPWSCCSPDSGRDPHQALTATCAIHTQSQILLSNQGLFFFLLLFLHFLLPRTERRLLSHGP